MVCVNGGGAAGNEERQSRFERNRRAQRFADGPSVCFVVAKLTETRVSDRITLFFSPTNFVDLLSPPRIIIC